MIPIELTAMFVQLHEPQERAAGARALAAWAGAAKVVLFGKDREIGLFLPALGTAQTLRGGTVWQAYLRECTPDGTPALATLPDPDDGEPAAAFGIIDTAGLAALVFIGGCPGAEKLQAIKALLPMLGSMLAVERTAMAAQGHANAARDSSKRAKALNAALDINRRELQSAYQLAESELVSRREAETRLRVADRRKDEFLAMLAHELRNPLAPISGAAQLLKLVHQGLPQVDKATGTILRQIAHLTSLVDDLLDVSRVTRGLVSIQREVVDLKTVVHNAIEQSKPLIEARGHSLKTNLVLAPALVYGDRIRLVQITTNLLNNAAKYTPHEGSIEVSLNIVGQTVHLSVSDNGTGIPADFVPDIFELFSQVERTPDRSQGGLGLGLALVKSITVLHGGEVTVHSAGLGQGSTFTITLPRVIAANDLSDNATGATKINRMARKRRVLLVDDNVDAVEALAELLNAMGHEALPISDPMLAEDAATSLNPDAFILDIGLPGMNGYDLARKLRSQHTSSLFIALSGYGQAHDKTMGKSAGFDHYFVKPLQVEKLQAVLEASE